MSNLCPHCNQPMPDELGIVVDEDRGEIRADGHAMRLTSSQFDVFVALYNRLGRVVSKEQIMEDVYWLRSGGEEPGWKIVDVYICKIRKKLKPFGIGIITHWGRGYELRAMEQLERAS